jgi:hypothetical protein
MARWLVSIKKFDKSFRAHMILIPMYVKRTSVQPLPGCRSDGQFTFRVKKSAQVTVRP